MNNKSLQQINKDQDEAYRKAGAVLRKLNIELTKAFPDAVLRCWLSVEFPIVPTFVYEVLVRFSVEAGESVAYQERISCEQFTVLEDGASDQMIFSLVRKLTNARHDMESLRASGC